MSSQKVAVVTGGNKGIGFAIVKGLCERFKGIVYLTARDAGRGEEAVKKLKELGFSPVFHQLDINDQSSVDKFRDFLKEKEGGIDILVNNAAIAFFSDNADKVSGQAETTISTNYFATLRVCEALFPLLRQNARVVNVSSSAGHLSRIKSADLRAQFNSPTLTIEKINQLMKRFLEDAKNNRHTAEGWGDSPYTSYCVSKVGLCALSNVHQKLFDQEQPNRNISVNSVHPGFVDTDMTNHRGHLTIEQGAFAPLFLALDADQSVKGKYLWHDAKIVPWDNEAPPAQY